MPDTNPRDEADYKVRRHDNAVGKVLVRQVAEYFAIVGLSLLLFWSISRQVTLMKELSQMDAKVTALSKQIESAAQAQRSIVVDQDEIARLKERVGILESKQGHANKKGVGKQNSKRN